MPLLSIDALSPAIEYPPIEPYQVHRLAVSNLHSLYIEENGNPQGVPILFLHGGPGSGASEKHRRLFDPQRFRIIIVDQRGAGRSSPHASLQENTTWDLVSDLEKIRSLLNIERWIIWGGSWGSTLALAYAQSFPHTCLALVLRGIFLGTAPEVRWLYQEGANALSPHLWADFEAFIPPSERHDMVQAYYKRLTGSQSKTRLEACKQWAKWELSNCTLQSDPAFLETYEADDYAISLARIECHYFMNDCFFNTETAILNPHRLKRLSSIPITIAHGRYDLVCPLKNAWDLYQQLPHADFYIAPEAGHASSEKGLKDALHHAVHRYGQLVDPSR
ncbi:MAG: prolyl aminopeptidase [Vampirovibrio sp.]